MTTVLERPRPRSRRAPPGVPRSERTRILLAVGLVCLASSWSLARVYVGFGWVPFTLAAVLLPLSVAWAAHTAGWGALRTVGASAGCWLLFSALTFGPGAILELWSQGVQLIGVQPPPAAPVPALMLVTTAVVWAVTCTVETMVFRLAAPIQALIMALVLWVSPFVIAPEGPYAWTLTVPFLAAATVLLLEISGLDLRHWAVFGARAARRAVMTLRVAGWSVAVLAIVAGVVFGRELPAAEQPAWYEPQEGVEGGTVNTSNPIVGIKARLVSNDPTPVLRTRTTRPVYLRVTALDRFDSGREEWTTAGIQGAPITGDLPAAEALQTGERIAVDVTVEQIEPGTILVPAPYLPLSVSGPASEAFQYDPRLATLTTDRGVTLRPGDRYQVQASVPVPFSETLNLIDVPRGGADTALPGVIPPAVTRLAREIVDDAGAQTAFQQSLAIQNRLQSWTYSLAPPPGHSASAMVSFLETRQGYCEQFAGTMAVMLRSLGIPSRVAVGYTPGAQNAAGEWIVTNRNAHAWVEVHFPGFGWIAFEPTPRDDGNVLVPSPRNLAPRQLQAPPLPPVETPREQPSGAQPSAAPDPSTAPSPSPAPASDAGAGPGDTAAARGTAPGQRVSGGGAGGSGGAAGGSGGAGGSGAVAGGAGQRAAGAPGLLLAGLLLLLIVVLVTGLLGWRHRKRRRLGPAERTMRARAQVERLGRGLGLRPNTAETDREYVQRLAGASPSGQQLATIATAAWYAPEITEAQATIAERAAAALSGQLLTGVPAYRRPLVRAKGACLSVGRNRAGRPRAASAVSRRADGLQADGGTPLGPGPQDRERHPGRSGV